MGCYAWITLESRSFGIQMNRWEEPLVLPDQLVFLEPPAPRVRPDLLDHLAQRDLPVQQADGLISLCSAGSPNKGWVFPHWNTYVAFIEIGEIYTEIPNAFGKHPSFVSTACMSCQSKDQSSLISAIEVGLGLEFALDENDAIRDM
ncbi:hypothetical protein C4J89_0183 [Pseudomonas sp. R4-35-07]|nr:hypothetical protein C4J89_0183 [Pseudomonas sp. R4-35-07]